MIRYLSGYKAPGCSETETLSGKKGTDYRGCQTKTVRGNTCQPWTSQAPHTHANTPKNRKGMGLEGGHNYCRNPRAGTDTIWCYTTDSKRRYELCVPLSPEPGAAGDDEKGGESDSKWTNHDREQ